MPTVTLNKSVLSKLLGKKLSDAKLKERISMLGTDLESMNDKEVVVEIFPNRPDLLSEQGLGRALSSFLGVKTGLRKYEVKKSGHKLFVKNTPSYYPYAIAFIAKNVRLDEEKVRELIQLQEKIGVTMLRRRKKGGIGLYPLEKLEFPITFEGRKPQDIKFRPLEYPKEISADNILEKHKKGKEYGHLMKDWKTYTVFVDNKKTIMSMPPIINSHEVGKIDESTQNLFVEATGTDLQTITTALHIFASTLADMGAELQSIEIHHGKKTFDVPNFSPATIKISRDYISKRIGVDFSQKDLKNCLERMGYGYSAGRVSIPSYRADIMHQVDIVEDVAIAYGYENLQAEIPKVSTIGSEDPFEVFLEKVRGVMLGLQLQEVKNYHLMNVDDISAKMGVELKAVSLSKANEEYDHLRPWIIPSLMKTLSLNLHNEYPQSIFEIGTVFAADKKEEIGVREATRLGVMLCYDGVDFTSIKQIVDSLLQSLGLTYEMIDVEHKSFIEGRVGRIVVNGKKVAYVGELAPQVLINWGVMAPAVALEINLSEMWKIIQV